MLLFLLAYVRAQTLTPIPILQQSAAVPSPAPAVLQPVSVLTPNVTDLPTQSASSKSNGTLSNIQLGIRAPMQKNGPITYAKALAKYNSKLTLKEAQISMKKFFSKAFSGQAYETINGQSGFAASTGAADDSQWLTEAQVGNPPQTLLLNFDTGSSDLWVFSTDLPIKERQKQVLYSPASSQSARAVPNMTWNITYADESGAAGFVGVDNLSLGGMTIRDQAIQRATYVSKDFFSTQAASGLLGLGFSSINTVKPNPVVTPFENMIRQGLVQNPIFTCALRDSDSSATGQGGHFTFGYLDRSSYIGQIGYAAVNTSQGFWQVNSPYFKIGRNGSPIPRNANFRANARAKREEDAEVDGALSTTEAATISKMMLDAGDKIRAETKAAGDLQSLAMPDHQVIIDTGTTLMLIDDPTLLTIYNQIPGAAFNQSIGGYTLPCSTKSPDTYYMIGDQFYGIPGSSLPFAPLFGNTCYGGIQSRGTFPMDIYGDTFIKNNYLVFDQGPQPKVGVAYRPDIKFTGNLT